MSNATDCSNLLFCHMLALPCFSIHMADVIFHQLQQVTVLPHVGLAGLQQTQVSSGSWLIATAHYFATWWPCYVSANTWWKWFTTGCSCSQSCKMHAWLCFCSELYASKPNTAKSVPQWWCVDTQERLHMTITERSYFHWAYLHTVPYSFRIQMTAVSFPWLQLPCHMWAFISFSKHMIDLTLKWTNISFSKRTIDVTLNWTNHQFDSLLLFHNSCWWGNLPAPKCKAASNHLAIFRASVLSKLRIISCLSKLPCLLRGFWYLAGIMERTNQ